MSWFKDYLEIRAKEKAQKETIVYTEEQLMARLKFFIGICLSLTLFGIVFVVLYSLIFVTQPLNAISPIDQKFFELIVPIATFLTGTLSGIMLAGGDKDARMKALEAANKPPVVSPPPTTPPTVSAPVNRPLAVTSFAPPAQTFAPAVAAAPFTPQVVTGFGGKPAPAPEPEPEL
jgi:hypothetical protein